MKRPQAVVAVVALLVGAAVTSMLLNLYSDVSRKMTQEFRAYGPNFYLAPATVAGSNSRSVDAVMDETAVLPLRDFAPRTPHLIAVPILYGVIRLQGIPADPRLQEFENVVAVGADFAALRRLYPGWRSESREAPDAGAEVGPGRCAVGAHLADRLHLKLGDALRLEPLLQDSTSGHPAAQWFRVASVLSTGASEDDQVFVPIGSLQSLLGMSEKISLVQMNVPGKTAEVEQVIRELARAMPGLDVRPIRQILYSEGKVLDTIRWLLLSLTALILVIIALCVMATMTAIVLERRNDIGVMKALGAADPLVMRLFLAEGAGQGLVGGGAGFFLGGLLAYGIARRLFDVTLSLHWWTLPLVCLLTMAFALGAALLPVRVVRSIQPAVVLKGE